MALDERLKGGRVTARCARNQIRISHSALVEPLLSSI